MRKGFDLLIDSSGSMGLTEDVEPSTTKYETVVKYLREILPKIYEPQMQYGLCYFGTHPQGIAGPDGGQCHIERVAEVKARPLDEFVRLLDNLPAQPAEGALTPLADAILRSILHLKAVDVEHRAIFVFSDGCDEGSEVKMGDVLRLASEGVDSLTWNRFELYAIGVGDLDPALKELAKETEGRAIRLETIDEGPVQEMFSDVAIRHLTPEVALRRTVEITLRDIVPKLERPDSAGELANALDGRLSELEKGQEALSKALAALVNKQSVAEDSSPPASVEREDWVRQLRYLLLIAGLLVFANFALVLWIADGVFSTWDVVTTLQRYPTKPR